MWELITEKNLPPEGVEVVGFSEGWIDEDFNPRGTRIMFLNGDNHYVSSKWNPTFDDYSTVYSDEHPEDGLPTHFMRIPWPDHFKT